MGFGLFWKYQSGSSRRKSLSHNTSRSSARPQIAKKRPGHYQNPWVSECRGQNGRPAFHNRPVRYGDKRWIDIDAMDKDRVVVVCPIGSLEQHGHHLPLLTDTYLVTEVAERVEKKLSDKVLLTPTLWLGASDHHLDFPGTVSRIHSMWECSKTSSAVL
jgi:hypothetical protein